MSPETGRDPADDFDVISRELELFAGAGDDAAGRAGRQAADRRGEQDRRDGRSRRGSRRCESISTPLACRCTRSPAPPAKACPSSSKPCGAKSRAAPSRRPSDADRASSAGRSTRFISAISTSREAAQAGAGARRSAGRARASAAASERAGRLRRRTVSRWRRSPCRTGRAWSSSDFEMEADGPSYTSGTLDRLERAAGIDLTMPVFDHWRGRVSRHRHLEGLPRHPRSRALRGRFAARLRRARAAGTAPRRWPDG